MTGAVSSVLGKVTQVTIPQRVGFTTATFQKAKSQYFALWKVKMSFYYTISVVKLCPRGKHAKSVGERVDRDGRGVERSREGHAGNHTAGSTRDLYIYRER